MQTVGIFDIFKPKERPSFEGGSYPIKTTEFLPIVEAYIDDKKIKLVIDTGASISVFDVNVFNKYFNKYKTVSSDMTIHGYGGKSNTTRKVKNLRVDLGGIIMDEDWLLKDISYLIDPIKEGTGHKISGILGLNNLKDDNIVINLGNNTLEIYDEKYNQGN